MSGNSGTPSGGNGKSVSQREPEIAVVPLNAIAVEDTQAGAARFNKWLQEISKGYITLERLTMVLGALPIVGNIIAAVDVLGDVMRLVQKKASGAIEQLLTWVSLGINLIGVIPIPPSMAAARVSLRPMLALTRQRLAHVGADALTNAVIELVAAHLNATIVGEIDKFVADAQGKLASIMAECGKFADKVDNAGYFAELNEQTLSVGIDCHAYDGVKF